MSSGSLKIFERVCVYLSIHNTPYPWLSLPDVGKNQSYTFIFVSDIAKCIDEAAADVPHTLRTMTDTRQEDGTEIIEG